MYPFHWIADPWNFIYYQGVIGQTNCLSSLTKTWTIYHL